MQAINRFFWLSEQALGFVFYTWPITSILLAIMLITGIITFLKNSKGFRFRAILGLLIFIFPILILIGGTIFAHQSGTPKGASTIISIVGGILFYGQIPFGIWLVYLAVGYRWFVTAQVLLGGWFSCGAMFVAGMAVTGDWI